MKTKEMLLAALLVVMLPALAVGYPGIAGGRGLLRVQNALVEDEAGLSLSAHGLGRNAPFPRTDKKGWVLDVIAPELSYAPVVTKYAALELFGSWGGVLQTPKSASDEGFTMSTHDLKAGGKLSVPILPVLKLGFAGSYTFLTGRKDRTDTYWLDRGSLPLAEDPKFTWAGLATLQFQDLLPSAPNVMVNYGKVNEETRYGLGVELAARGFALFGEVLSRQGPLSDGLFDTENGSIYLTPGIIFGNASAVSMKIAYSFAYGYNTRVTDVAKTAEAASNELILGLVIATPFGTRAPAARGVIAGRVVDERTGDGLRASVSFPTTPQLSSLRTSAAGVFTVDEVPAGVVMVEVAAEGYQGQTVPVDVPANTTAQYEFKLRPLVTHGTIAGTVTDANTNRPLAATIEFPGSSLAKLQSDPATGAFRALNVPSGIYTATASADGYFKGSLTVQVEEGQVATSNFALRVLADVTTLTGKVSDKQTGAALAATVSFPDAGVEAVKSAGATGVYAAELPVGSYAVKVVAPGYIDQTAALVMEKGKPVVKNFELVKEGMTITLRGVYFDFDRATIKPESRPALEDAAKILKDNPTIRVEIQGHTDSDGAASYNQGLSERRAQSVVNYLIQNFGIDRNRLTARGYGEGNPIATNATAEGKALNRRVEFVILNK